MFFQSTHIEDSRRHPQPRLLEAAQACVLGYLHQKRSAALSTMHRVLLPNNGGLLLSAIDRLLEQNVIIARDGGADIVIELAEGSAREVGR